MIALRRSRIRLASAPPGDGHPVLVIPGFLASDRSTATLRAYLDRLGYRSEPWTLGRNLGMRSIGTDAERLMARIASVHERYGEPVSLIGWSLGGVMARLAAHRRPDLICRVITLAAPFNGDPKATTVWRAYEYLSGHKVTDPVARALLAESAAPLPVQFTAIYTLSDGVVPWRHCREASGPDHDNIEVPGSHIALALNHHVFRRVAERLADPIGAPGSERINRGR